MDKILQTQLISLAHGSILEEFNMGKSSTYEMLKRRDSADLNRVCGIFVTIKKEEKGGNKVLRGCIGTIEGVYPVVDGVYKLAKECAFEDPRFLPLSLEEYYRIAIQISLLSPLKEIHSFDEITLGTHGVVYEYHHHRALFLPEVATEQHWSIGRLLNQLCIKASLPPDHYKGGEGKLFTFTVESFGD